MVHYSLVPQHCTYVYPDGTKCMKPCVPLPGPIMCGAVSLYCTEHTHNDN